MDLRMLHIDFKGRRLGHPDFEIKFIDLFASDAIEIEFFAQECL